TVSFRTNAADPIPLLAEPRFPAPSTAKASIRTSTGKVANGAPWKFRLNVWESGLRDPPLMMESLPTTAPVRRSVAIQPSTEIPLGSVARTVIESRTSTRLFTVKVTFGGVVSLTTDWMVTGTARVRTRRADASSANPTMVNIPDDKAAGTVSVSVNVGPVDVVSSGGPNRTESPPVT